MDSACEGRLTTSTCPGQAGRLRGLRARGALELALELALRGSDLRIDLARALEGGEQADVDVLGGGRVGAVEREGGVEVGMALGLAGIGLAEAQRAGAAQVDRAELAASCRRGGIACKW